MQSGLFERVGFVAVSYDMVYKPLSTAKDVPHNRFQLGVLHTDGSTDVNTLEVCRNTTPGWGTHISLTFLIINTLSYHMEKLIGPRGMWKWFYKCNFQIYFFNWYLYQFVRNCSQKNANESS